MYRLSAEYVALATHLNAISYSILANILGNIYHIYNKQVLAGISAHAEHNYY